MDAIDQIGNIANWSPEEKLIVAKSKLRSQALEFFINSSYLTNELNYENFKKTFIEYFKPTSNITSDQQQFSACKQMMDEPVKKYAHRVINATLKYLKIQNDASEEVQQLVDRTKLAKFLEGLKSDLQRQVLNQNPKCFRDAIDIAVLQENNLKFFQSDSVNAVNTPADNTKFMLDLIDKQNEEHRRAIQSLTKQIDSLTRNQQNKHTYFQRPTHFENPRQFRRFPINERPEQNTYYHDRQGGQRPYRNAFHPPQPRPTYFNQPANENQRRNSLYASHFPNQIDGQWRPQNLQRKNVHLTPRTQFQYPRKN